MAISFTKLGLKKDAETATITINDCEVLVSKYLPVEKKIEMITKVVEWCMEEKPPIWNPVKAEVFFSLELVYNYTNISFTEKQKENPQKLYDTLEMNGVFDAVVAAIGEDEYNRMLDWTYDTIKEFNKYRRSAVGVLEQIAADYSNLNLDAEKIHDQLADPENLALVKDIVTKLG